MTPPPPSDTARVAPAAPTAASASEPAPALRRDAQRNLDRVMEEATRLFSERGPDVSIAEVAAAAGVGKATVYRSFPTKEDLLEAVALRRHQWFADRLTQAAAEPVAWDAFTVLVRDLSTRLERDRTLGTVLRETQSRPALQKAKAASKGTLEALCERAIGEGEMRPDTNVLDIGTLLSGYSIALTNADAPAEDWDRLAGLVIDAFRAR